MRALRAELRRAEPDEVEEQRVNPVLVAILQAKTPTKDSLVRLIPRVWDLGLKDLVRNIHERFDPIPEDEEYQLVKRARDNLYDNMYSHLETDLPTQTLLNNVRSGSVKNDITKVLSPDKVAPQQNVEPMDWTSTDEFLEHNLI